MRATAQSHDGDVEVTVDSTGGLAEQMSRKMAEVLGSGSETARFVTETYTERFPPPTGPDGSPGQQR